MTIHPESVGGTPAAQQQAANPDAAAAKAGSGAITPSVPAGTPAPVIQKLSQDVKKSMEAPETRQRAEQAGVEPRYLAPADMKKEGSGFDLPIALGVLAGMGELDGAVGIRL